MNLHCKRGSSKDSDDAHGFIDHSIIFKYQDFRDRFLSLELAVTIFLLEGIPFRLDSEFRCATFYFYRPDDSIASLISSAHSAQFQRCNYLRNLCIGVIGFVESNIERNRNHRALHSLAVARMSSVTMQSTIITHPFKGTGGGDSSLPTGEGYRVVRSKNRTALAFTDLEWSNLASLRDVRYLRHKEGRRLDLIFLTIRWRNLGSKDPWSVLPW